ncbi:hypothetical protein DUI87_05404 [Hirundo rustica rustica]|uniref:Uncharacterized protein n=1 Tax=Hirundo rustica rustica TaxID=333673 RepID=A0A3M0KWQ2_HIRRU|nr:hypothetical protein DUI87_05404 [Hirundo rustica rustica]
MIPEGGPVSLDTGVKVGLGEPCGSSTVPRVKRCVVRLKPGKRGMAWKIRGYTGLGAGVSNKRNSPLTLSLELDFQRQENPKTEKTLWWKEGKINTAFMINCHWDKYRAASFIKKYPGYRGRRARKPKGMLVNRLDLGLSLFEWQLEAYTSQTFQAEQAEIALEA